MGLRSWRISSQEIEAFPVTWIHSQDKYVNGRQRSPSSELELSKPRTGRLLDSAIKVLPRR